MPNNLLIIESPAKAKTIKKYLGSDFKIMASVGHLKDLPTKNLGVDIDNNFEPQYTTIKGKGKILKGLKEAGKHAEKIYLAPDPDREGEAIAWHIAQELKTGKSRIHRVLFNELTAKAIRQAIASPQDIDSDKFESQQARRVLDRLVGYQISPLLWSKVKGGLSAGRVQSVAVRMICEREKEIYAFEPQEYWSLTAHLEAQEPPRFKAKLSRYKGKKIELKNGDQTNEIISEIQQEPFKVAKVQKKKKKKNPPPPFITSLLQQEASRRFGFSAKKTMSIAQNLYEGIELGEQGQVGLITYMRTDSFHLADDAVSAAREYIHQEFGKDYLPNKPNHFKSRKGAQEAHEAIRPTSVDLAPDTIGHYLSKDQLSLYTLIWKRFVACQMNPALLDQTQVDIKAGRTTFRASGSIVTFKGFTILYTEDRGQENRDKNQGEQLPPLEEDQLLTLLKLEPAQHFTQPPPRFTEATLIKALEENGIGRPSTYAAILSNISGREYVVLEKKRFKPTELGFLVTDFLIRGFPDILNTDFTAQMENNLDKIEQGKVKWTEVLRRFYDPFLQHLKDAEQELKGEVQTEIVCDQCNRPMVIKSGRNGLFLACTGYPECTNTADYSRDEKGHIHITKTPEIEEAGVCEKCGSPMVVKKGKFGSFIACSGYPACKNTRPLPNNALGEQDREAPEIRCKSCDGRMIVKINRSGQRFLACENYPQCTRTEAMSTNVPCPNEGCKGTLVERLSKKGRKFYACNRYPECRFATWDEPFDETCPDCGTPVLSIKTSKDSGPFLACRKKGCHFTRPLSSPQ
ncbi:MAG: type I DNA topoisomerase [Thermodesulfobacteriota bacterium]|nr:type I DNA topoisomerase [Thermodesulfobacteriota bacterium]